MITVDVFEGVDTPGITDDTWHDLLHATGGGSVFQTRGWIRAWERTLGRHPVLVAVATRGGEPCGFLPVVIDDGWLLLAGAGTQDRADVLAGHGDLQVGVALIGSLLDRDDVAGATFHHVVEGSLTHRWIEQAAVERGATVHEDYRLANPVAVLGHDASERLAGRKSLRRAERWLTANGELSVRHTGEASTVLERLPDLFELHIERWRGSETPSLFEQPEQQRFFEALAEVGADEGWLRFCEVRWNGAPVALHLGSCFRRRFFWYKPTFDQRLAKRSPGEVLLRNLFLAAAEEADVFDFGIGDEAFKHRFATDGHQVLALTVAWEA